MEKLDTAERSFEDYSCKFVTITGANEIMAMFSDMIPKEQEMFVWIKKPYLMKTKVSYVDTVFTKEGEDFYLYYWTPQTNTLDKAKVPQNSWPSYPSPESELKMLKAFLDKSDSYTIEENNQETILTIESFGFRLKNVYYIDKTNSLIVKRLYYEDDQLSITSEWRDIKLNNGLSDKFFEFQIPDDAKHTTRDLTRPKE